MSLVGSYIGLSKLLVAALPVFLQAWLRFGVAALAMAHWVKRTPGEAPLSPRDRTLLFFESLVGNFLFSICMLFGVAATSALAAGVVMSALPAAVALLSWLILRERIRPRVWVAIACTVFGVALLTTARHGDNAAESAAAPWWGYALLLGAVLCEALYVVIGKRLTAQVSPRRISALINLWGLALVTPLGLWQALRFDFDTVTPGLWAMVVFYALAASVWSVWLWMRGLASISATQAGVFTVMLPVAAALVGVVVLGEAFTATHAAAMAVALTGLLLATWPARAAE